MKQDRILLGMLASFATGAFAGVLFAPQKGSITRKSMLDKWKSYFAGLKEKS